jgi:hypothetical protein
VELTVATPDTLPEMAALPLIVAETLATPVELLPSSVPFALMVAVTLATPDAEP